MPVCVRCGRMQATAELRRRKPPYTGQFVCKDGCTPKAETPGAHVNTPLGPGVVMNLARSRGKVTTVLVRLDADRDVRGEMGDEAIWRAFSPEVVTP